MSETQSVALYPDITQFIESRKAEFDQIPRSRKEELSQLADYVRKTLGSSGTAKLTFICTHNSRRSHLSQIWAKVAADAHGLIGVETYSGGTEATAMNPRVVDSLRRCGMRIEAEDVDAQNPRYSVSYGAEVPSLQCFSKVYDAPPNPTTEYCAIMTCSSADEACPIVLGCDLRLPIRYEDPKASDGTPEEQGVYDERSRQICREMLFAMQLA